MGRTSARGHLNGVRAARTARGLTQADLARDVGVTRQTVVALEAGDYGPSVYLALAVAARLGSTVEQLFGQQTCPDQTAAPQEQTGADQPRHEHAEVGQ